MFAMKTCIYFLWAFPLILWSQTQRLEVDAGLGLGYADYREQGSIRPVKSDWSGGTGSFHVGASAVGLKWQPYFGLSLTGSEVAEESWKENGALVQTNDMSFGVVDLMTGLAWPLYPAWGTFTPSLGLMARYQSFTRENFVFYVPGARIVDPSIGEIDEDVEMYGVGGGFSLKVPLGESWEMAADTRAYWLFYSRAENDAFESEIEGEKGWIWQASLTWVKTLLKPGQVMGLRLTAELQNITGEVIDNGRALQEWPDNEWRHVGAELYWQGEF